MKREIQHPEAQPTGRKYWRSVEEYADTADFHEWLQREFPAGASEMEGDDVSRRSFLKLMGASFALAGFGLAGCRRPESHIVPFTAMPEWMVLGKYLHYSSAMPRRGGAMPLLVTTYNGRPTKIEGHPGHAQSKGKTDAFAQASILDLYDPDRSGRFLKDGVGVEPVEFYTLLDGLRKAWQADGGASLVIVADETLSPTRERLRKVLKTQFPQMTWATYEPLDSGREAGAMERVFGEGLRPAYDLSRADVLLAVDRDVLNPAECGLKAVRDFAAGRRVEGTRSKMNRLYVVENRFTNTGALADHRLRLPVSHMGAFMVALLHDLARLGAGGSVASVAARTPKMPLPKGVSQEWVRECARDLLAHKGRALVAVGANQPVSVQLIGLAVNEALGALGQTFNLISGPVAPAASLADVASKIKAGQVQTLIILGANPVYNAPADLNWASLQKKVPNVIHHGLYVDETAVASGWHVPAAHYLESWGDAWAADGSYLSIQPMILPLFGGISQIDLLAKAAGLPMPEGPEQVRQTFSTLPNRPAGNEDAAWNRLLHDGSLPATVPAVWVVTGPSLQTASMVMVADAVGPIRANIMAADEFEVVFAADYSVEDGRYNNNGWMQEFPDPVTKLTWENAALISPSTAKKLGIASPSQQGTVMGSIVRISVNGAQIQAPVLVVPGCADHSITLPLGYGRSVTGRVGEGSGFNAYPLRTSTTPGYATGAKVEVRQVLAHQFAVTQDHHSMEGRAIVREAPVETFRKDPHVFDNMGIDGHIPPNVSFYPNPGMDAPHQWAMTVDLSMCTGCNACVVACQAENNIPIVGKEQVKKGREMHWIRIDRYFSSENAYDQDKGELPDDAEMLIQPVACMQCENAPCETVCPVNATVHNEEGLNVMAYNRCIGTRYCANNCPYKVRRFNWFDFNQRPIDYAEGDTKVMGIETGKLYQGPLQPKGSPDTLRMQKNPNVTVRMRGVMEKCTFCVQRLESAKIEAKIKAGPSPDITIPTDSVQTACQQACPADAIVFGNEKDPRSRVARTRKLAQGYVLLKYLNTLPRITYLGRLRNPNMRMPGADRIGTGMLGHHGHGGAHEGAAHGSPEGHGAPSPHEPSTGGHH